MTKEIKLLNHQYEVLEDTTTEIIGLVGGYGNGKTYTACRKAIQLSYLNPSYTGIVTEPTFPMLRDIFIPEMKLALEEWGVPYKFNASNSIFLLDINGQETKILCMSMENVERLIGVNAAWVICDEFDTSKASLAYKAFMKLLGRLRAGIVRQFVIFTTPEGFKATYRIFVTEMDDTKRLIKAKTTDNKYLPKDFVERLKKQYPPQLLEAYLNGEFVNLTTGTIFSYFNREKHHIDIVDDGVGAILISQDFNIGGSISCVYKMIGNILVQVDEFESYDTREIVQNIKRRYPNRIIEIYPDASGANRKTSSSESDLDILRNAGFSVYVNNRNPSVRDRITISNNCFDKNIVKINTIKCPKTTQAYEQHSYKENGEPDKINGAGTVDDYTDAGTYILAYKYPIARPTAQTKLYRY